VAAALQVVRAPRPRLCPCLRPRTGPGSGGGVAGPAGGPRATATGTVCNRHSRPVARECRSSVGTEGRVNSSHGSSRSSSGRGESTMRKTCSAILWTAWSQG